MHTALSDIGRGWALTLRKLGLCEHVRMRLLIVEDSADIAANLGAFFEGRGHAVDFAEDGLAGLQLATTLEFDVILLDIMLPGLDGLEFARQLREVEAVGTPILMLTARDTLDDRLAGFRAGGDDYLVKPFSLLEVEARVHSLFKRARGGPQGVLQVADLRFDTRTLEVERGGRGIQLKPMARRLLEILLRAHGRAMSREALEHAMWGEDVPEVDALRVHVHALRHAIDGPGEKALLHTIRGVGYRLADLDT